MITKHTQGPLHVHDGLSCTPEAVVTRIEFTYGEP